MPPSAPRRDGRLDCAGSLEKSCLAALTALFAWLSDRRQLGAQSRDARAEIVVLEVINGALQVAYVRAVGKACWSFPHPAPTREHTSCERQAYERDDSPSVQLFEPPRRVTSP